MGDKIVAEVELAALTEALRELGELRGVAGEATEVSAWSGDQHLYHIALATDLALTNVQTLVAGTSPRIVHGEEPTELAKEVLRRGSYPRGESEAPRMVRPPDELDAELLIEELDRLGPGLDAVRSVVDQVEDAPGAIRHHELGSLSAAEWLRFARMHGEHHLAIVRDIAAEA